MLILNELLQLLLFGVCCKYDDDDDEIKSNGDWSRNKTGLSPVFMKKKTRRRGAGRKCGETAPSSSC